LHLVLAGNFRHSVKRVNRIRPEGSSTLGHRAADASLTVPMDSFAHMDRVAVARTTRTRLSSG
jgi:hypothetical protein